MRDKTLLDGILEYLKENNIDISFHKYYQAWPIISGIRLSSCTKIASIKDIDKGILYITPSSLSAKSLLLMEEKRIISDWNKAFPDKKLKKLVAVRYRP